MCGVQDNETPIVHAAHRYEHCRHDDMLQYEIFDYLPAHSTVYKQWIEQTPGRFNWDLWLLTGFIGVLIGITGLFMQQIIMSVAHFKWSYTEHFIQVLDTLTDFRSYRSAFWICLCICRCISLCYKICTVMFSVYGTKW